MLISGFEESECEWVLRLREQCGKAPPAPGFGCGEAAVGSLPLQPAQLGCLILDCFKCVLDLLKAFLWGLQIFNSFR